MPTKINTAPTALNATVSTVTSCRQHTARERMHSYALLFFFLVSTGMDSIASRSRK